MYHESFFVLGSPTSALSECLIYHQLCLLCHDCLQVLTRTNQIRCIPDSLESVSLESVFSLSDNNGRSVLVLLHRVDFGPHSLCELDLDSKGCDDTEQDLFTAERAI